MNNYKFMGNVNHERHARITDSLYSALKLLPLNSCLIWSWYSQLIRDHMQINKSD